MAVIVAVYHSPFIIRRPLLVAERWRAFQVTVEERDRVASLFLIEQRNSSVATSSISAQAPPRPAPRAQMESVRADV